MRRPFHRQPNDLEVAKPVQSLLYLLLRDRHWLGSYSQLMIIPKLHSGAGGDSDLKYHWIELGDLKLGLSDSFNPLFRESLLIELGQQAVQSLIKESASA